MVPDISHKRRVYMFIEGLKEHIKIKVKPFEPQTLEEAIRKAKMTEYETPREKSKTSSFKSSNQNEGSKRELKKCFHCQQPWNRDHQCKVRSECVEKGLCFKCKGPWTKNRQCKRGQMNNLEETINKEPTKRARLEDSKQQTLVVITQGNENRPFQLKGVVKG